MSDAEPQIGKDIAAKLRRLMEVRQVRDEAKVAAENAEKEYREYEADVWESIEESPVVGNLKVDLGAPFGIVSFRTNETYYGRVIDKEDAMEYFEQRAMMDEVSQPKLVMARVNEVVNEHREQGKAPPPGLDWYAKRYVTITRQKD